MSKIVILFTGGTISMRHDSAADNTAAQGSLQLRYSF